MSSTVLLETTDGVATVTLNRPDKRNALSRALIHALKQTFEALRQSPGVRSIILTGAGPAFCAGMDLEELRQSMDADPATLRQDALHLSALYEEIRTHPLPTIAAINGAAIAGGAGLMTVCDLAVAIPSARFGYPEVRRGLVAAMVLPHLLRHVSGRAARYLLLTGELIDADEALACGLINRVVPEELLRETALNWAATLSHGGPEALRRTKELFAGVESGTLDAVALAEASAAPRGTEECRAGLQAFFDKTPAPWLDLE